MRLCFAGGVGGHIQGSFGAAFLAVVNVGFVELDKCFVKVNLRRSLRLSECHVGLGKITQTLLAALPPSASFEVHFQLIILYMGATCPS